MTKDEKEYQEMLEEICKDTGLEVTFDNLKIVDDLLKKELEDEKQK